MNATEYATATGRPFTAGTIAHLLRAYASDFSTRRNSDAGRSSVQGIVGPILAVYGPDAEEIMSEATDFGATLEEPPELVWPLVEPDGISGDSAEGAGVDAELRSGLKRLASIAGTFGCSVYVSSAEVFGSPVVRELAYAVVWAGGGEVIVNGRRVDPDNRADSVTAALRPAARSSALLYAALRGHDRDTIVGEETTLEAARMVAGRLRDDGWTLEQIARRLEREAIPTRRRSGSWSPSAVRELLFERPRVP